MQTTRFPADGGVKNDNAKTDQQTFILLKNLDQQA